MGRLLLGVTLKIPVRTFAGIRRTVIKSNVGPLVAGHKVYTKVVVAEGVGGAVTVSLCADDPPWTPVDVAGVVITLHAGNGWTSHHHQIIPHGMKRRPCTTQILNRTGQHELSP
jgi:hypothetical protein